MAKNLITHISLLNSGPRLRLPMKAETSQNQWQCTLLIVADQRKYEAKSLKNTEMGDFPKTVELSSSYCFFPD